VTEEALSTPPATADPAFADEDELDIPDFLK
jgi:cell division protein FtsZ